ncbi:MAG: hypothetical protein J7L71_09870, partial [Spirochaetaceae bacterium]|nr:hypothetical protein [Spirochaetaceae bacterium]
MTKIYKNIAFIILVLFVMSIIPFPLLADNIEVYKDIFTDETQTEIYIPVVATHVPDPPQQIYSQKITQDTMSILEYDGVKLEIPAGAVEKEVTIAIIKLESVRGVNETIKNVTTGAASYRFLPDGIKFTKNITISIPFDKTLLESETALSNLFTYFYDEESRDWVRLPRVEIDKKNAGVVSLTNHFTDMINGTLKMPESPGPVNFDINSIKNLEAANPSTGVMSLKGLTSDSEGAASFQIPLNLPPGRGSAYPNLTLSYNSDSPNSWMGRGFDISVPSITTDTRFGLPDYDDTDTYILGGEELVLTVSSGSGKIYHPRVEKDFKRIIRKLEDGVDYWEVTDKNGRMQTFGTEKGWVGPDRNNHAKTYAWYLTKETDAHGNFTSYIYDYDSVNKYTYLKEIRYSGNNNISSSDSGPYKVVFNTDIDTQKSPRPDRRIDARGTFVSKLIRRLDEVEISYNDDVFRTYTFGYKQNEFGQTLLETFTELDGNGNEFYEYGFSYNTLSPHDAGAGVIAYDGFGTDTVDWGAVSDDAFPGLNQTGTFGVGASLYLGLTVKMLKYSKWFNWDWNTIAAIGVRGGVNFSGTIANSTLLDINGDGLPDTVWKDGGVLKGFRNTGSGFDTSTSNDISLSNLPGLLNSTYQKGYSLGASASIGSSGGSISWQNNWTEGLTAFNDINGDGFIDFIKSDDNHFYMNTLTGFTPTEYTTNTNIEVTQSENFADKEEDYQRTYYIQEPVRKWKAFTSGTIDISQSSDLVKVPLKPDEYEGVKAVTYLNNGDSYLIELTGNNTSGTDTRGLISVRDGDEVFFHMDAGNDTRGDDINWNIDIAYTDIDYFESINESAVITLGEQYSPYLPGNSEDVTDTRLDNLYDKEDIQVYPPDPYPIPYPPPEPLLPIWKYALKTNWKDFLDEAAVDAIIEHGLFVPGRIPEALFTELFGMASITEIEHYEGGGVYPGGQAAMIDAYFYRPEFKDFIRIDDGADEIIPNIIASELSLAQRQSLFYYTDFTGKNIYPEDSGGVKSFLKSATLISIDPKIDVTEDNMTPGAELYNGEILLDEIYNETGDEVVETLRLVPDNGSLQMISTGNQGSGVVDGSSVSESAAGINASFLRNGIKHSYSLSSPESILTSLPPVIYDSEVLDAVTSGYNFAYFPSYTSLSISEYNTIFDFIGVAEEKDFFQSVYSRYPEVPDIEEYILKDPITTEERDHLNTILPGTDLPPNYTLLPFIEYTAAYNSAAPEDKIFLEEVYSRSPEIPPIERYDLASDISSQDETRLVLLFDALSDDGASVLDNPLSIFGNINSVGIIALSEAEYTDYFEEKADFQSLFTEVVNNDLNTFFILKNNITEAEKNVFETACQQYLRDKIEFPYYEYNEAEGLFTIKSGLDSTELTEISTLFSELGLSVFTDLN